MTRQSPRAPEWYLHAAEVMAKSANRAAAAAALGLTSRQVGDLAHRLRRAGHEIPHWPCGNRKLPAPAKKSTEDAK